MFVSVFASGLAMILAGLVWFFARTDSRPERAWMYDGALICVVGLFRLFKLWENKLAPLCGVDHLQAFRKVREVRDRHRVAFWILAPSYILFVLIASLGRWPLDSGRRPATRRTRRPAAGTAGTRTPGGRWVCPGCRTGR